MNAELLRRLTDLAEVEAAAPQANQVQVERRSLAASCAAAALAVAH